MEIPIAVIGGAGFFPARKVIKETCSFQSGHYESAYEEELNTLGIEAKNSDELLAIIFAIETQWILNAPLRWSDKGSAPKRKFEAVYRGIHLWMFVNKRTKTIHIRRILSDASHAALLERKITTRDKKIFRTTTHYLPRPRNT